jgi:aminomethyltransferase
MLPGANNEFWQIVMESMQIGYVTSAIHSPRLQKNIALAMVHNDYSEIGLEAKLHTPFGQRGIKIVPKPFYDPKKKLAVVANYTASNNNSGQIVPS